MRILLPLLISCLAATAFAQGDSVLLDQHFRFTDGLYRDEEAVAANRPDYLLSRVDGSMVMQENNGLLKVSNFFAKGRPDLSIAPLDIWMISVGGRPYVRVRHDEQLNFTTYALARLAGRLSYAAYDSLYRDTVVVSAYNPRTGRPFRRGNVTRPQSRKVYQVLDLASGRHWAATPANLETIFREDAETLRLLRQRGRKEITAEDLELLLRQYNQRHPFYLAAGSGQ